MSKSKQHALQVRAKVCALLRISEEEYGMTVLEAGLEYAQKTSYCAIIATIKTHSSIFWAWFENQFAIVDELFLRSYQYSGDDARLIASLKQFWLKAHFPETPTVFPPASLYSKMSEEVAV